MLTLVFADIDRQDACPTGDTGGCRFMKYTPETRFLEETGFIYTSHT